jgi:uncharacterized protein (DUF488 family)
VRAHPGSRRVPWTAAAQLGPALAEAGIGYRHAPALGGRRQPLPDSVNGAWANDAFRGYADHMATPEFADAIAEIEAAAAEGRVAAMCAEAQWWRCHRRLVADALTARGGAVQHIRPDGGLTEHELTPFAVAEGGRVLYPPPQGSLGV